MAFEQQGPEFFLLSNLWIRRLYFLLKKIRGTLLRKRLFCANYTFFRWYGVWFLANVCHFLKCPLDEKYISVMWMLNWSVVQLSSFTQTKLKSTIMLLQLYNVFNLLCNSIVNPYSCHILAHKSLFTISLNYTTLWKQN